MKNSRLIIGILAALVLLMTTYIVHDYQNLEKTTKVLSNKSVNESTEGDYEFGEFNKLESEYHNVLMDLEADNFINQFETVGMEEAITLDEFKLELNKVSEDVVLDDATKCRIVKRWLRKQKCRPKRKVYKQVANKTKIGSISYQDQKITINAPQIVKFRNETNRLNVLMELYYNLKSSYCDSSGFCYTNALLLACVSEDNPAINDAYKRCTKLYTGELQNRFVEILKLFYGSIEKFNDGTISEDQVKQVVNAQLDDLNQALSGAEEEKKEDEEDTKNDEDS